MDEPDLNVVHLGTPSKRRFRGDSAELERAYGALRWVYTHGMQKVRPQAINEVLDKAFASHRIAQEGMPPPARGDKG